MPDPRDIPIQTRPTPVVTDGLFYEVTDGPLTDQVKLQYGSAHPNTNDFLGFFLCKEDRKGLETVVRWWGKEYTLEDTYNDSETFSSGQTSYPIYRRRYIVLRSKFTPRVSVSPLHGVVLVQVTNGGTGYTSVPTVTPNAGTGTFTALINEAGNVVAVVITNAGTYTAAPTLAFAGGGGAAAAATAFVQPQTALLVEQEKQEFPEDDPRRSIFVIHDCTYETLPGPLVENITGYEDETGALMERFTQRVLASSFSQPGVGTEFPAASGMYTLDVKFQADEKNEDVGTLIVDVMAAPITRTEYISQNYPIPRVVTDGGHTWPLPPANASCPTGPYNGWNYILTTRAPATPLIRIITYGIPGVVPFGPVDPMTIPVFGVTCTPASASRLPITEYTIHPHFTVTFNPGAVLIDDLPASTPSTYPASSNVIVDVSQQNWKSAFQRRIVTYAPFPA